MWSFLFLEENKSTTSRRAMFLTFNRLVEGTDLRDILGGQGEPVLLSWIGPGDHASKKWWRLGDHALFQRKYLQSAWSPSPHQIFRVHDHLVLSMIKNAGLPSPPSNELRWAEPLNHGCGPRWSGPWFRYLWSGFFWSGSVLIFGPVRATMLWIIRKRQFQQIVLPLQTKRSEQSTISYRNTN